MGIYGRDYMRDEPGRGPGWAGLSVTTRLIIVNVVLWFVFAGARSFGGPEGGLYAFIRNVLLLHPEEVFGKFRIWQPVTALFFHDPDGFAHLLFNMLFLYVFGKPTEDMIGGRALLQLYLIAGVASTLALVPLSLVTPGPSYGLGASGAVYGIGVFLALRQPQMPIYFFFIRMPLWVLVGVFMVGRELVGLVLLQGAVGTTVAHLTGALFGFLYELRYTHSGPRPKPHSREHRTPEHRTPEYRTPEYRTPEVQADVDALLEKIHEEGIGSLTPTEKDFLEKASRRYGRR